MLANIASEFMTWLIPVLQSYGGWGVAALITAWLIWSLSNENLVPGKRYVRDLQTANNQMEWWREVAMTSSEIGHLLTEVKTKDRRDEAK